MKTFEEVFKEIKESVPVSPKGKVKRTFSRSDFDKLAKAYLNEYGMSVDVATTKNGVMTTKKVEPVVEFRGMIKKILLDFGVDKQEAENIMNNYQFTSVDGVYEICSELIYQYIAANKKFDFLTKEDFKASLTLEEVEESVKGYKAIDTKEPFQVKTKSHKILKKDSKAPKWLKEKMAK